MKNILHKNVVHISRTHSYEIVLALAANNTQ